MLTVVFIVSVCVILKNVECNSPPYISTTLCKVYGTNQNLSPNCNFFSITEEQSKDTLLVTFDAIDNDNDSVKFSLIGDSQAAYIFYLQDLPPRSVRLLVKERIDKENIASDIQLKFTMDDNQGNNNIQFLAKIIVRDINDNDPIFQNIPYRWRIPEGELVPNFNLSAWDKDSESFINFEIQTSDNVKLDNFFMLGAKNMQFPIPMYGFIYNTTVNLIKVLDYEVQSFYQLTLVARDNDNRLTTTDIIVNVIDKSDNPPIFLNLPYFATVIENSPQNQDVIQIQGIDGDRGINNKIKYSFVNRQFNKYFTINETTGSIKCSSTNLDREDPAIEALGFFTLQVNAIEVSNDSPPAFSVTDVRVQVNDVNDNAPTFSGLSTNNSFYATVMENSQTGIPISMQPDCKVIDLDSVKYNLFTIKLEKDGLNYTAFTVSPATVIGSADCLIRVAAGTILDYETTKKLVFDVVLNEPSQSNKYSARVYLDILDVNDNRPNFSASMYKFAILENSPNGTFVGQVTATDIDSGQYGTESITYSFATEQTKFAINRMNGIISVSVDADKVKNLLDRETFSAYFLNVQAADGGDYKNNVQVEVNLLDTNDNAPRFARDKYFGRLKEGETNFINPVTVEATDVDLMNIITYGIVSGNDDGYFKIESKSGVLLVNKVIDFEILNRTLIQLNVSANDNGSPTQFAFVLIDITIEDVNDNAPVFSMSSYSGNVSEIAVAGTKILKVFATDADQPGSRQSQIVYRILTTNSKFTILSSSGDVIVSNGANLDVDMGERISFYQFNVTAEDLGDPTLTGTALISITVQDVNDEPPFFNPVIVYQTIFENLPRNSLVPISPPYKATDVDTTQRLVYSIVKSNLKGRLPNGATANPATLTDLFAINATTGDILVQSNIDREKIEEITVPIQVVDLNAATPVSQTATGTIIFTINDINDEFPQFLDTINGNFYLNMSESQTLDNSGRSEVTLKVLAQDPDKNDVVTFFIDPPNEYFSIGNESGQVYLIKMIDFETIQSLKFIIRAIDKVGHMSNATVNVNILDANDNAPVFYNLKSSLHVWENASVGDLVETLYAYDNDTGIFGQILFELNKGGDNKFKLEASSGRILVNASLDRDVPGGASYVLSISARDMNGSSAGRVTPQTLEIIVDDVNDNAPQFVQNLYGMDWKIFENFDANYRVGDVEANDLDIGANSQLIYYLEAVANETNRTLDLFAVRTQYNDLTKSYKAVLWTKTSLRNAVSFDDVSNCFNASLVARDAGIPSLSGTTRLTFCISDVNDYSPNFVKPNSQNYSDVNPFILGILEYNSNNTQYLNQLIYTVQAKDKDFGDNGIIRYAIKETSFFKVDFVNGDITIAKELDRETQPQHTFYIMAFDFGRESSLRLTTSVKFIVNVNDIDDNPPIFPEKPINFRIQRVSIKENTALNINLSNGVKGALINSVGKAEDKDIGINADICYFMLYEKDLKKFYLNKTSGNLYTLQLLDADISSEKIQNIYIKAVRAQFCNDDTFLWRSATPQYTSRRRLLFLDEKPVLYDPNDGSQSAIILNVEDVNDNPPRFISFRSNTAKIYFTGVTSSTKPSSRIFDLGNFVSDPDSAAVQALSFSIVYPLIITPSLHNAMLERNIQDKELFFLDNRTGLLSLGSKVYFQDSMQGYFSFNITVSDGVFMDSCNMTISLLSRALQVIVVFRENASVINQNLSPFIEFLSNTTGWEIVADSIDTHLRDDGTADIRMTDMYIHALTKDLSSIVSSKDLLSKLDAEWQSLTSLYNDHHVVLVKEAISTTPATSLLTLFRILFFITAGVFLVALLVCIVVIVACRHMYRRKLKAVSVSAFGPVFSNGLRHAIVPGTNQFTYEGSNPIWMESYNIAYNNDDNEQSDQNSTVTTKHAFEEQERRVDFTAESDSLNITHLASSTIVACNRILDAALQHHEIKEEVITPPSSSSLPPYNTLVFPAHSTAI